jgi:hypothetical protein
MLSPFPGMDPYIEACSLWEDFHDKLVGEIERALAESLPNRYAVRLGERSYVVLSSSDDDPERTTEEQEYRSKADVAVSLRRDQPPASQPASATATIEAEIETPINMRALVETEYREIFAEIIELHPERRLITTIEVLSPANKRRRTAGWFQYTRKRQAHLEGNANLVEIDLLRGGERLPMEDEWPASPYYLLMSRRKQAPMCTVWPVHFVRPLPVIPVPLAPPDPDASLAIQPMIEAIYKRSRYEQDIDYRQPCRPPLGPAEAAWFEARLRELQLSA